MIAWCDIKEGTIRYSPSLDLMGWEAGRFFIAKAPKDRLRPAIQAEALIAPNETTDAPNFNWLVPGVANAKDQLAAQSAILDFQQRINKHLAHLGGTTTAWFDAALLKPDSDITVLCGFADGSVETGYFDSEDDCWRSSADALRFNEKLVAWADLPEVPKAVVKGREVAA